ncbi:hypothetical protein J2S19_004088 [Metabacillus malikii]|uniref:Uncharacterized protein n=1 Tax=Metabacillus malikii TaxID=1504265 RepID=A0ABT9ZKE3_9BACI|nr:hypothetical protein [Metabacillus malikii]
MAELNEKEQELIKALYYRDLIVNRYHISIGCLPLPGVPRVLSKLLAIVLKVEIYNGANNLKLELSGS